MHRRRFLQILAGWLAALGVGLFHRKALATVQISGNYSGTIPTGTTAQIVGNVNLTGDLIVEGTLTGIDTFTVAGNGFQILVQNGGVVTLAGKVKKGWTPWGGDTTGWVTGDRLGVAPTKVGVYVPTVITWQGSWAATVRPVNSPDVTLVDGSIAKPEVANLTRSIKFINLRRLHFHEGAGVQSLKHLAVVDSGTTGVLGDYPLHFHLNGEASRGSIVEAVVVEGGKNHAFVPHASYGVSFVDCVAYNTKDDPYWWDRPLDNNHTANNTNDNLYDHCLALGVSASNSQNAIRLTGFLLLAGSDNRCVDSVAAAVSGGTQSSGFHWPEHSGANVGGAVWQFDDCVSHNNNALGLFNWQNDHLYSHPFNRFDSYRNGRGGIISGAYRNDSRFRQITSTADGPGPVSPNRAALWSFAKSEREDAILFEDYLTDGQLVIAHAPITVIRGDVVARRATWTNVLVQAGTTPISYRFEDCGLLPADFTITSLGAGSVLRILEGGVEIHRWQSGVWS